MRRVDSLEKTLMLGGIGGRRRRGQQRMRWLDGNTDSMDMSLSELRIWCWTGRPGVLQFMGSQRVGHNWVTELNWTEFALIHGPDIPDSYAILLFIASDLASITRHFHSWALFLLWLHPFIPSGVISPVAYWEPTDLGSSPFSVLSFCLFILFLGFSRQEYWSGLPFLSPVDHILSGMQK